MAAPLDFRPAAAWAREYGPWPDDYLAADIESSGVSRSSDWPVQIGWCVVRGRRAVREEAVVLNWPAVLPPADAEALATRLDHTRRHMTDRGSQYPWTPALMREKGVDPRAALAAFSAAAGPDPSFVTHFGWGFDYPMIGRVAEELGTAFEPDVNRLWDTALLVKACQIGYCPRAGERLPDFVRRVHDARPAGKFSLPTCCEMFGFKDKFGVAAKHGHSGGYDSWLVHLVFERVRDGAEAVAHRAGGLA